MKRKELNYAFEVRPLSEDDGGGYLITFPDLPGCMSDGETVNEAIVNGLDAVECWLDVAKERGQHIPEPKTKYSGQFVQRISKTLHARLVAFAKHEGISMNALVAQFISEGLANAEMKENLKSLFKEFAGKEKSKFEMISNAIKSMDDQSDPDDYFLGSTDKADPNYRVVISDKSPYFYIKTKGEWEESHENLEESLKVKEWNILYRQEITKLIRDSFEGWVAYIVNKTI